MADLDALLRSVEGPFAERSDGAQALERLRGWWELVPAQRSLLNAMAAAGALDELHDCFRRDLPFGTAGRRGAVGPGPNRMNPFTLAAAAEGHARYLEARGDGPWRVFLAWDGRRFANLRGRLPGGGGSLHGLRSVDLARTAACVYAANGVEVSLFDPDRTPAVATPELAFQIRRLQLDGGMVVSASHNHPDDNGCKLFDENGGQAVPPEDEALIEAMVSVDSPRSTDWQRALAEGWIRFLDAADLDAYLRENLKVLDPRGPRSAKVVFTNLHGVGDRTAGAALERAGFDLRYVPEQRPLDGAFPAVPFRVANPEVPSALQAAMDLAADQGADLVLGTDPDADRVGCAVPDAEGRWRFLTGNQILCLVAAYRSCRELPPRPVAVTTEVSTRMFRRIWEAAGAQVADRLLVGCKYIAEVIHELERHGRFQHGSDHIVAGPADFVMGCEEAHGIVLTPSIRDKDGATPALLLAELAALERARGQDLWSAYLRRVILPHGAVWNEQVPLVMEGPEGAADMRAVQEALRSGPPASIAGKAVVAFDDRMDPTGIDGPFKGDSDRRARNLLVFGLEGGDRVVVRPSGTEPKFKIYTEALVGEPGSSDSLAEAEAWLAAARARARGLALSFADLCLRSIGVELSAVALAVDPLVPVRQRQRFDAQVLPELSAALDAGDLGRAQALWSGFREKVGERSALYLPGLSAGTAPAWEELRAWARARPAG
jgi:phosphoglucomutase/phosphomannomutase